MIFVVGSPLNFIFYFLFFLIDKGRAVLQKEVLHLSKVLGDLQGKLFEMEESNRFLKENIGFFFFFFSFFLFFFFSFFFFSFFFSILSPLDLIFSPLFLSLQLFSKEKSTKKRRLSKRFVFHYSIFPLLSFFFPNTTKNSPLLSFLYLSLSLYIYIFLPSSHSISLK